MNLKSASLLNFKKLRREIVKAKKKKLMEVNKEY
jgi:hypothetical protein